MTDDTELDNRYIVIGGDFNMCLNPEINKGGGDNESKSKYAQRTQHVCESNNLHYMWHTLNPETMRYSRRYCPVKARLLVSVSS